MEETLLLNPFLNKHLLFLLLSCHFLKDFIRWPCATWNQKQEFASALLLTSSGLRDSFL